MEAFFKKRTMPKVNKLLALPTNINIFKFFKEVWEELSKVVWPTREQTIRYTVLVIIIAVGTGAFLGGLDYVLTAITAFILKNYGR